MKKFIFLLVLTFLIPLIPTIFIHFDTSSLIEPPLFPPKILFPIVWSILYLLMTISIYLSTKEDKDTYLIYFSQLVVNAIWTPLFFGLKWYLLALLWIILLIILVIIMIIKMFKKNRVAGYLEIPYLIWLIFATYLNFGIMLLN